MNGRSAVHNKTKRPNSIVVAITNTQVVSAILASFPGHRTTRRHGCCLLAHALWRPKPFLADSSPPLHHGMSPAYYGQYELARNRKRPFLTTPVEPKLRTGPFIPASCSISRPLTALRME